MYEKNWYQSRTMLFNLLLAVAVVVKIGTGYEINNEVLDAIVTLAIPVIGVVLRLLTKNAVKI